jgi:RNA-directed DNA polymerase
MTSGICAETHLRHKFVVKRHTSKKRMRTTLQAIKTELMKRRHEPVVQTGKWLNRVVRGYFNYHAVPGNLKILSSFRREVALNWLKSLRRRSQRSRMTWERFAKLINLFIPLVRRVQEYPHVRFNVKHS